MAKQSKIERIVKFIEENDLDLLDEASGLNSSCTTLAGFILYVGYKSINAKIADILPSTEAEAELVRVFEYAKNNSYGYYWETAEARKMYKF